MIVEQIAEAVNRAASALARGRDLTWRAAISDTGSRADAYAAYQELVRAASVLDVLALALEADLQVADRSKGDAAHATTDPNDPAVVRACKAWAMPAGVDEIETLNQDTPFPGEDQ